jgi:hypothetical protein
VNVPIEIMKEEDLEKTIFVASSPSNAPKPTTTVNPDIPFPFLSDFVPPDLVAMVNKV